MIVRLPALFIAAACWCAGFSLLAAPDRPPRGPGFHSPRQDSASAAMPASAERQRREGMALAEELRSLMPVEETATGVLHIRHRKTGFTDAIPVILKTEIADGGWKAIYLAEPTPKSPAERLIIERSPDKPNRYFHAVAPGPQEPLGETRELAPDEAAIPFARSDFSLTDLGLDFLHWPDQRKLPGQMRLGRSCHVLESRNPDAPLNRRVKSFIDKETGGILIAEAYDQDNRLRKEFNLSGRGFKKIDGRWHLEEMKISTPKLSDTTLKFHLPNK